MGTGPGSCRSPMANPIDRSSPLGWSAWYSRIVLSSTHCGSRCRMACLVTPATSAMRAPTSTMLTIWLVAGSVSAGTPTRSSCRLSVSPNPGRFSVRRAASRDSSDECPI